MHPPGGALRFIAEGELGVEAGVGGHGLGTTARAGCRIGGGGTVGARRGRCSRSGRGPGLERNFGVSGARNAFEEDSATVLTLGMFAFLY